MLLSWIVLIICNIYLYCCVKTVLLIRCLRTHNGTETIQYRRWNSFFSGYSAFFFFAVSFHKCHILLHSSPMLCVLSKWKRYLITIKRTHKRKGTCLFYMMCRLLDIAQVQTGLHSANSNFNGDLSDSHRCNDNNNIR